MALLVLEEAARSARDDLDSVRRSVDAIDQQKRAARGAAHALDEAGERAAEHLRTVDQLTEAASRSVGAALAESGAHASEAALEELDSWARPEQDRVRGAAPVPARPLGPGQCPGVAERPARSRRPEGSSSSSSGGPG